MAIPGFDKTFYLNAKLEQLQSDSATAADWAGKDVAFLEARLLNGFGLTAEAHYEQYGYQEDLAPNAFFNPAEYIRAKATDMFNDPASSYLTIDEAAADFVSIWNGNVYNHYLQYGEGENINPSNSFDVSAYLETKLADLQAKEATAAEWAGKSVADVAAAFKASGLTALEHFTKFGQDEGLSAPAVPAEEQVEVDTSVPGQVFSLTAGADNLTGTENDDTFVAGEEADGNGDFNPALNTVDALDGGLGNDTLRVATEGEIEDKNPTLTSIENVELVSGNNITFDTSNNADVTSLKSIKSADSTLTASDTQDVEVSGATGAIDVAGGKDVTVTDSTADEDINVGESGNGDTNASGTITVTDSKQGTGNIVVDGGTDVTIDATSEATGTITVGNNEAATGAVSIAQTLEHDGTGGNLNGGDITVTGGSTVDVTVNANSVAEAVDSDDDIAVGNIAVTGDENTTDVTVTQNDNAETFTSEEVALVPATQTLTFKALTAGQTTTVDGLTFTASEDLTAEQVASAFANLTSLDTQAEGGSVENGIFTGALATTNLTSGEANGSKVVFTAPTATYAGVTVGGNVAATAAAVVAGTAFAAEDASENTVTYGDVDVDDHAAATDATIETITLDGFGDATIGATNNVDALTSLTLKNSVGDTAVSTAVTSLDVTLDGMGSAAVPGGAAQVDADVTLDTLAANVENLTLTTENQASFVNLTAAAVSSLTVNAGAALDLSGSTMSTVLETVDVNGAGAVDLGDISTASGLNSFDAADNTGGVTATVTANGANVGDIEEYVFSAGADSVTLNNTTVNVDVTLGAGDDSVTLASGTTALNATVDGGEGTDTLAMDTADAVIASNGIAFEQNIQGFERLSLDKATVTSAVDMANMDDINYVISGNSVGTAGTPATIDDTTVTPTAGAADQLAKVDDDSVGMSGGLASEATILTFNIAGLELNDGGTLSIGGQQLFEATSNGTNDLQIAANLPASVEIEGITYNIAVSSGTAVELTAQSNALPPSDYSLTTTGEVVEAAGNTQQYDFDIDGLILDNGGTLTLDGDLLYTAGQDGVDADAIAEALDSTTDNVGGVTYNVTATGTALNLESTANVASQGAKAVNSTGQATGSALATLTLDNFADDGTLELDEAGAGVNVNVDGADEDGADANVLNLVTKVAGDLNFGTVTADDVETVNIDAQDTTPVATDGTATINEGTLTLSADAAASVVITGNSDLDLTTDAAELASVNATAMTGALTFTANVAELVVNAGAGNDVLTASASGVVLNGGAGNDTLTGADLTQLTGGEGADTFVMNTPTSANSYATITDLEAGDIIDLSNVASTGQTFSSAAVTLASTAVFQDYANASVNQLAANNEDFAWFQFGGNTFIIGNDDQGDGANDNFENGTDSIIQITGLVDLSTASYNQDNGTLEIA